MRTSHKYFYIYLFLIIFLLIGFICGFLYFNSDKVGEGSSSIIDVTHILSNNTTPLLKDIKFSFIIFLSTFLIILMPYSIFKLFFFNFSLGFLFHLLLQYGLLFAFVFSFVYFIIPMFFLIIMFKVGLCITKNIIMVIFKKQNITSLGIYIKKYIVLMIILFVYECLLFLFSGIINNLLIAMIR